MNEQTLYLVLLPQSMLDKQESCGMPSLLHYTLAMKEDENEITFKTMLHSEENKEKSL